MAAKVLVVEDEPSVREVIRFHLERAGFVVLISQSATDAWTLLESERPDAVVLDWMLPDASGMDWLKRLRLGPWAALPVMMLTARASEADRVDGLDAGADDYLTKPFSAAELTARVRALLRRGQREQPKGKVVLGALELCFDQGSAWLAGRVLELTRREFDLLGFLMLNPGRVYSRQELLDRVWGPDFLGGERTVDQHVTQLRSRLGDDPEQPGFLETVRGKGYRLRVP